MEKLTEFHFISFLVIVGFLTTIGGQVGPAMLGWATGMIIYNVLNFIVEHKSN